MDRVGQVVALTPQEGFAIVQMRRHAACGDCGACQLGEENLDLQIEALNHASAKVGDWVVIELGHQSVMKAAFIAYTIPLMVLVASISLGILVFSQFFEKDLAELLAFGLGVVLTGICYVVIRQFDQRFKKEGKFQSIIARVVSEQESIEEMKEDGQ
jgi:sigma-E factor negative regulatory protein RseC